jgi:hypothetical protein
MAYKLLGKTRHRRMELRHYHGRHESCDGLNCRRSLCVGEAIPLGDSVSVISLRIARTEVDLSWSAVDRANERRRCGYFGRVASRRNNSEFVAREVHLKGPVRLTYGKLSHSRQQHRTRSASSAYARNSRMARLYFLEEVSALRDRRRDRR